MLKRGIILMMVMSLMLLSSAAVLGAPNYRNVLSTEANKLIEQKKNLYLLDVRTPQEFSQGRLKGSVLIPINEIERRVSEVPKNRPILVICAVGSRSNLVAGYLVNKGYGEVYNLADGLMGWSRNGFSLEMKR